MVSSRYLDPKDRTREIPPETSIKYMESVAFKTTYGDNPVWLKYRRNFPVSKRQEQLKIHLYICRVTACP